VAKAYPNLTASLIQSGIAYAQDYLGELPPGEWGSRPGFVPALKV
jgi:hypothetical protein